MEPRCPIGDHVGASRLQLESLWYCPTCQHGWADLPETPSQYEQEYFSTLGTRADSYTRWLEARYANVLAICRRLEPVLNITLDVGCGQGEFVQFLTAQGLKAVGLEPSQRYSADCRARGLAVQTGTTTEFGGEDRRYDLVSFLHVLEHLTDPISVLASVRRLIRPGGLVYVEIPNEVTAWRSRVKRILGRPASSAEERARCGHRQCFSFKSVQMLMTSAGFEAIRTDTRDYIEPSARLWKRLTVAAADFLARCGLIEGNVIRCWGRSVR